MMIYKEYRQEYLKYGELACTWWSCYSENDRYNIKIYLRNIEYYERILEDFDKSEDPYHDSEFELEFDELPCIRDTVASKIARARNSLVYKVESAKEEFCGYCDYCRNKNKNKN